MLNLTTQSAETLERLRATYAPPPAQSDAISAAPIVDAERVEAMRARIRAALRAAVQE